VENSDVQQCYLYSLNGLVFGRIASLDQRGLDYRLHSFIPSPRAARWSSTDE